jgi:hypothetical protein
LHHSTPICGLRAQFPGACAQFVISAVIVASGQSANKFDLIGIELRTDIIIFAHD